MARIFYLGAPAEATPPGPISVQQALQQTGYNTGNLLIGHALKRQLDADVLSSDCRLTYEQMAERFDFIVIGASNFLHQAFDFGTWADLIEAVDLPCAIIGVGAQAPNYGARVGVSKGTERLMRVVAERSKSLGVRGVFSASALMDLGIKNVRVIGCPGMFWNRVPHLSFAPPVQGRPLRAALNGSANVVNHALDPVAARELEGQLARISLEHNYPYILQNETLMMEVAAGSDLSQERQRLESLLYDYSMLDLSLDDFLDFVRRNTRSYFAIEPWIEALREFDFVVGSRFHGCLLALLAGVPAFVFVHDTRTRELCELLHIPHVAVTQAGKVDVPALYASLDLEATKTAYRYLYQNYISFLDENGVPHRLKR